MPIPDLPILVEQGDGNRDGTETETQLAGRKQGRSWY